MQSVLELWQLVCNTFQEDKRFNDVVYNLWISCMEPKKLENNQMIVQVSTEFQKGIIMQNYADVVEEYMTSFLGQPTKLVILSKEETEKAGKEPTPKKEDQHSDNTAKYTFDSYVVGESNRFAAAACQAVAKNPAKEYNPLFIYGKSGLGKTHLMFAIENQLHETHPHMQTLYVKCETFTNEFIQAVQDGTMQEFNNRYRQCDVLLVDDIQFLANKEQTQEAFFHTFYDLYFNSKQIVLTSDRLPREIATLDERLRTRFESGLTADVHSPDFETRCAIVRQKAEQLQLDLGEDVTDFLASKLKSNIRQLEGAVTKLAALFRLEGTKPTIGVVQSFLKDLLTENKPIEAVTEKIVQEVAHTFQTTPEDIKSKRKTAGLSLARHVCFWMMKELTPLTMKDIGQYFGGKDHTTVLYGCNRIAERRESDSTFAATLDDIMKNVKED